MVRKKVKSGLKKSELDLQKRVVGLDFLEVKVARKVKSLIKILIFLKGSRRSIKSEKHLQDIKKSPEILGKCP